MKKRIIGLVLVLLLTASVAFAGSQTAAATLASAIITRARYVLNEPTQDVWLDTELLVWLNEATMDIVTRTHCLEGTESITLLDSTQLYAITGPYIVVKAVVYQDALYLDDLTFSKTANPDTITTAAGDFLTAGFEAGDEIVISETTSNNDTETIVSLTATVITLGNDVLGADEGTANADALIGVSPGSRTAGEDPPWHIALLRGTPEMIGHVEDVDVPTYWFEWDGSVGILPTPGVEENNKRCTVYFVERPTSVLSTAATKVPAQYEHLLLYYIVSRALQKDKQWAKAAYYESKYEAILDRFRTDLNQPIRQPE